jgi:hypothetical protein
VTTPLRGHFRATLCSFSLYSLSTTTL